MMAIQKADLINGDDTRLPFGYVVHVARGEDLNHWKTSSNSEKVGVTKLRNLPPTEQLILATDAVHATESVSALEHWQFND